ncbi:MAG: MmcQ/YjbR family DNA-binding protein [Bacteroidetes bacterium]|nr:MAG: MmcQ/YjbR family DNA-binding protein [Bacteroidota bacterium]
MNLEEYRDYCLSFNGVTEGFPFDSQTLVFKVGGKMFALCDVDLFDGINLKCDPDRALELRESHQGIRGGYHMNKRHWNTVETNSDVDDELIRELTKHSYELIYASLPKKIRDELQAG